MKEEISHYHETIGEALQVKNFPYFTLLYFCISVFLYFYAGH